MLCTTPVQRAGTSGHGTAGIQNFANLVIDLEIGGDGRDRDSKFRDFLGGNSGGNFLKKFGAG